MVRTPLVVLKSLRYRHIVHTVEYSVPDDISHHLSIGLKYLLGNHLEMITLKLV